MPQENKTPESRVLWAERRNLPAAFASLVRPVVTVSAPAGYGKSTLLDQWRRDVVRAGAEVVSLVVDADDRGNFVTKPIDLDTGLGRSGVTYTVTAVTLGANDQKSDVARLTIKR